MSSQGSDRTIRGEVTQPIYGTTTEVLDNASLEYPKNPEKQPMNESPTALRDGLRSVPIPENMMNCDSFDFLYENEEAGADPEVESLDSEIQRRDYLKRVNDAARDSFASKTSYNCRSVFLAEEVDWTYLRSCVALGRGYVHRARSR